MKKSARELRRAAEPLGWSVDGITGGGHLRLVHESGGVYYAPATPSDSRARRKALADMRRLAREAPA